MLYTDYEKHLLQKVNAIGLKLDVLSEVNIVFVALSPYLDTLMSLLKRLKPLDMDALFIQYPGVSNVMQLIEDEAQKMEKELGIK